MHFDVDKILEDADAREVAEAVGMKIVKRGSSIFTECPEHEKNTGKRDTDYDRCVISKRGYYCFSCGAKGNVIDMVRQFLGQSFQDACKTICSIIGTIEDYTGRRTDDKIEIPYSKAQLEALGLYASVRAYLPVALCETREELSEKHLVQMPGEDVQVYIKTEDKTGCSLFLAGKKNPEPEGYAYLTSAITGCRKEIYTLNALFKEEPEIFHELVKNKSQEMYWKWKDMLDSGIADKLLVPELAYHVNTRYKNWMGICERIYQGYGKQTA